MARRFKDSAHKTTIPAGIRAIAQRFWRDSQALPPTVWSRWWKTLAIGLGICSLVAFVFTQVAASWQDSWLQSWDEKWLIRWQDYSPLTFANGVTWESPGNLIGMLPIFLTLTALTAWFKKPLIAATAIATYIGQFAIVWISWGTWNRARPTLIADGLATPNLHSFPSGHVVVSMTMYGLIFYLWYRSSRSWLERMISITFATFWIGMISLSRLALGAHWPSDVIMGLFIGALWLITVILALERAERKAK